MKPDDLVLCYVSGVSCWVGILEVKSQPYRDDRRMWKSELYPCRVDVKVIAALEPARAVPIKKLRDRLTIFQSRSWGMHFMGSPARLNLKDSRVVIKEIFRNLR
jgi:predicted RNA-binding protein